MNKQIYISADYSEEDGDREVVNELNLWGSDNQHSISFIDMAKVASGSVSNDEDCRPCDLKKEFNRQINASSCVIFVVGNKTALRTAGSNCVKNDKNLLFHTCTPYKQNTNGLKDCKVYSTRPTDITEDVGEINNFSYLRHEFEQAKRKDKDIIILYNSTRKEEEWLPNYMKGYEEKAFPFWIYDSYGNKKGNYLKVEEKIENV